MSDDISTVQSELADLGYSTSLRIWNKETVVEFDYCVEVGSLKGETVRLGLSFKETGYSEYPPHWIHVSPPVDDDLGGSIKRYDTDDGRQWVAMSRPPKELWDGLPVKDMKAYLSGHMRRFWNCI